MNSLTDTQMLQVIPMLVGLVFVALGLLMVKFPPKKINYFYGYRTSSSMRNQRNWDFSQNYSAIIFMKMGLVLILSSFILLVLNAQLVNKPLYIALLIIVTVIYAITKTEFAIKKSNA